jgi:predicted tellurium resistance membrane protein TerC
MSDRAVHTSKIFLGVLCFGIGMTLAVRVVKELIRPTDYVTTDMLAIVTFVGSVLLLGSYLRLRRPAQK